MKFFTKWEAMLLEELRERIAQLEAELKKEIESRDGWHEGWRKSEEQLQQAREALKEQLDLRGYAFRGKCDGVPNDVRRAFIAIGTPCDEIDKQALEGGSE